MSVSVLKFESFDKKEFIDGLKNNLPNYKVQKKWGGLVVNTGGITYTGNVRINTKPEKGEVKVQINYDNIVLLCIFVPILGLYNYIKREKQKALKQEVIDAINVILEEKCN